MPHHLTKRGKVRIPAIRILEDDARARAKGRETEERGACGGAGKGGAMATEGNTESFFTSASSMQYFRSRRCEELGDGELIVV